MTTCIYRTFTRSSLSLHHLSHLSHYHLSLELLKVPLIWFLLPLLLPQPSIHSPLSSSQSGCLQKQIWCWASLVYPSQFCCWRGSQPTPALYLAVSSHSVLISHINASNELYLTRPCILPKLVPLPFYISSYLFNSLQAQITMLIVLFFPLVCFLSPQLPAPRWEQPYLVSSCVPVT